MIFVIVPLGKAASDVLYWLLRVLVYATASTLGGALVGAAFGALGLAVYSFVPGATRPWPLLLVGVLALLYALHESGFVPLPHPERAWQVPNAWLRRWPIGGSALFGLVLGSGLFTFIPYGSFYVLLVWEAATGNIWWGAALGGAYGLLRGLPVIIGGLFMLTDRHPLDFNMWLLNSMTGLRRIGGGVLAALGLFLLGLLLKML